MNTVYLLHFNTPYRHARHYIGYTTNLDKRITDHLCGMGARLMEVITAAGIEWKVARTWRGDRRLELARPSGASDYLLGDALVDLFIQVGGFIPRLLFLSACHSGDILRVKDWNDFLAVVQGKEPGTKQAPETECTGNFDPEQLRRISF